MIFFLFLSEMSFEQMGEYLRFTLTTKLNIHTVKLIKLVVTDVFFIRETLGIYFILITDYLNNLNFVAASEYTMFHKHVILQHQ